jgi:hypothetical protein
MACGLVEWLIGGNGRMAGMAGMAEWQKEWQNGRMAEMDTYVLFMVHADDTLIFYITEFTFLINQIHKLYEIVLRELMFV